MLTFKRAVVFAALFLALIFFLRSSHSPPTNSDFTVPNTAGLKSTGNSASPQESAEQIVAETALAPGSSRKKEQTAKQKQKQAEIQKTLVDMANKPLRDQLAYQFPYDVESKFPAYIWQTWKYTPASGEFQESFRPAEASWTEKHPGFVHEVITDQVAVHLIRHLYASVPEVVEAYKSLPRAILKADFFRYLILLARGGIYADIDTLALKSTIEWLPETLPRSTVGLVVGIEADPDRPDWAEWYSRRIQFCQWTIQSKPGHPVLRDIVATITDATLKLKESGVLKKLDKSVVEFTGPAIWTDAVFRYFNNPEYFDMSTSKGNITWEHFTGIKKAKKMGDVVVLPITSFSPGVQQMGAGDDDDPMAFVKHAFEGTWKPEKERHPELHNK
ncbi:glycosyltransferase family 32 protein [Xylona heveae TC161]|uniref:Glycosyltransferase family 32 protein n=1 Tax=Xylona heveae (strain CBS 132557 / TC161) TaxID=1328760 RepID=A0A165H512_XYLHT|nr:glycosyltransferase family 32 protein [Xylona heveae TC161]KZF22992.1 glycosyltransferase family 32 protein [Xylona heveae TC161]